MLAPGLAGVYGASFGVSEEAHTCVFRYEHWRDCDRPREAAEIQATQKESAAKEAIEHVYKRYLGGLNDLLWERAENSF